MVSEMEQRGHKEGRRGREEERKESGSNL